jgi:predicted Zn-dependent protease
MACLLAVLVGCETLDTLSKGVTSVGVATGTISSQQANSINKSTSAVGKTFDKLTPQNEYYVGRAVGASLLSKFKLYNNKDATAYVNTLGQTLAVFSTKPETWGGYHFMIMDTDEINAFAAPGGLILVSRGLLRCCKNENALAGVLAHEIGHVQLEHAVNAIKKSRIAEAGKTLLAEAGKNLAGEQVAQLTTVFEGSLDDVKNAMLNGYAKSDEFNADKAAVAILVKSGYGPDGLKQMLQEMDRRLQPSKGGFGKTHPDPNVRINEIQPLLNNAPQATMSAARQERFEKALAGV